MSLLTGPLPTAVDHRLEGTEGPIKSQGAVGACTAFSLSSTMDNEVRRMGRGDVIAPLHVWSKYAIAEMSTAGDETVDQAIALEPSWPYDPAKACKLNRAQFDSCGRAYGVSSGSASFDPGLQAEKAMADSSGRYRLIAVERLQARPADINEMAAILAGGDDLWASFSVNGAAWSSDALQGAVIPDYTPDSDEGHAVVLSGYRTLTDGSRQFLIHNSWGVHWGDQGFGWISEAMVSRYLRSAYKIRIADASAPFIPLPASGGCPQGQVKDAVLGSCAPVCPSGSAPAAGVCLPTVPGFPIPGGSLPTGPLPFPLPTGPFPFPLPPGIPLPGPTPQTACPAGQAPDLLTGQCQNLCPGGAPAMGGMCIPLSP